MSKITTVEELDALPVGSVVRNNSRAIVAERLYNGFGAVIGNRLQFAWADLCSPGSHVTVLYRPDRPSGVTVSDEDREALIVALRRDAGDYAAHVQGTPIGRDLTWDQRDVRAWQAAEAIASRPSVPTETEWGVRWANGQIVGPMTEAEAHAWKSGVPVRREVTEWRPADE